MRTLIAILVPMFLFSLPSLGTAQTTELRILESSNLELNATFDASTFQFDLICETPMPFAEMALLGSFGTSRISFFLIHDDDDDDELTKCFKKHPEPVKKDGESDKDYNSRRQQWKNDIRSCMNQHPPRESDSYVPPKGGAEKSGGGWKDKDEKIWKPWNPATPGHSPHWDRQKPDGSEHENKYPNPPIPEENHGDSCVVPVEVQLWIK